MTEDVVRGCLDRVRRGDVSAVGVLADYLEENNLPYAKRIRGYWDKYVVGLGWVETADFSRRKLTKWEAVARWRRWLRNRVAKVYVRKWKGLKLKQFIGS